MRNRTVPVVVGLLLAGTAPAVADFYLHNTLDLSADFGPLGNNPNAVTSDGTYAYIGGYSAAAAPRDIGILKINLTNPADKLVLPGGTQQVTQFRYYGALFVRNGILYALCDRPLDNSVATTNVRAIDTVTGALVATFDGDSGTGNGIVFQPAGMTAPALGGLAFDPGFGGTGGGVSIVGYGTGRRVLLDINDGTTIFDTSDGMPLTNPSPTCTVVDASAYRDHVYDAAGNVYLRRSNQVQVAYRSGPNAISGYGYLTDELNADGSPRVGCGDGRPVGMRLAPFVIDQNIEFIPASSAATNQDLLVFNDRPTTAAGKPFRTTVLLITTTGALPSPAVQFLNGDGTPLTTAEVPDGTGAYDFHYDAAGDRLLVLDFTARRLYVFGTSPLVTGCAGDLDCSGLVDFDDIGLFVEALNYPGGAGWPYPGCPWSNGDCNNDGQVNFDDIDPFVARIGATCP